jgi:alpha-beta hydrolase superfamily lysophospholipase
VRWLATVLFVPCTLYAIAVVVASLVYRRFLYPIPPGGTWLPDPDKIQLLTASDGVTTRMLQLPPALGQKTIVHFHGNGETIGNNVELAERLSARGFGVALVEYRGYGLSAGSAPTEAGLYRDAEAALEALLRQGIGPDKVILWGASLGTGVAAEMARRKHASALVLFSPFTSAWQVAARIVPFLPMRLIFRDKFDTLHKAAAIDVPTVVVHGDRDELIPFEMGRAVASSICGSRFIPIAGGHHNDLLSLGGTRLLDEVTAALAGR